MFDNVSFDTERKLKSILRVISAFSEPVGSTTIARELKRHGIHLTERAIRYHLKIADERGYTKSLGRNGRMLTSQGLEELKIALASERFGYIIEKLELLAFLTTFDPVRRTGLVPINVALIDRNKFKKTLAAMRNAFRAGICTSQLVAVASEGQKLGAVIIPTGKIGLASVCSCVFGGVLLKAGVHVALKFEGVLGIRNSKPERFLAVINYEGTSLDPSEQYVKIGATSVRNAAKTGTGRILANFGEIPAPARVIAQEKAALLQEADIDCVCAIGNTFESVCQIPVGINRIGIVLFGGLNPLASAFEAGIEVECTAEGGLIDFKQLQSFWEL